MNVTTIRNKAVRWAQSIADDQRHGYSQANRWGPDYDCSSLVISAYEQAGIPVKTNGATYTGDMRAVFLKCGFKDVSSSVDFNTAAGMIKGDVLMYHKNGNIGHTALYEGNGTIVHARGQSYGSPQTGDQGTEIQKGCPYYRGSWQYCLRLVSASDVKKDPVGVVGETSVTSKRKLLVKGAVHSDVALAQFLLNQKGFRDQNGRKLDVDGELGDNTAYAITQLQKKAGMKDINFGTIGNKTWKKLLK